MQLVNPYTNQKEQVTLTCTNTLSDIREQDGRTIAHLKTQCPPNEFGLAQDATQKITADGDMRFAVEARMMVASNVASEVDITVAGDEITHQNLKVTVQ